MDPGDATSIIFKKIRTLEPDNAPKLIGYFLLQDMEQTDLIRLAFGPDTLLQTFCRQAKSALGLSSKPISIHQRPLPQSSPSNGFLDLSRNPNPNSDSTPFLDGSSLLFASSSGDEEQLSNDLSFLDEEDPFACFHERSFSANDSCLEPEEPGFGIGGGAGYRFPQAGLVDGFGLSGGESGYGLRMKLAQQQRMAAQFMALRQEEENGYYYSPSRHERDDSVSRQIYLTFPSESSFTDEDVSSYFSEFGAVEDVRIPYQQQRMYGFVTFANAETVRTILARGNPHFICDSRVLVKPYKEKGKILQKRSVSNKKKYGATNKQAEAAVTANGYLENKKGDSVAANYFSVSSTDEMNSKWQQQQVQRLMERGSYSPSSSPCGMDLYECHLGPRMFSSNTQEMMMRRKADLQLAIDLELQRRFLALKLPERENERSSLSIGSPAHLPPRFNHSLFFQPESIMEGDSDRGETHFHLVENSNEERGYSIDFYDRQETRLESTLPDSLVGSPKKSEINRLNREE